MTGMASGTASLAGVVTGPAPRGASDRTRGSSDEDGAFGRQVAALDQQSRNPSDGRGGHGAVNGEAEDSEATAPPAPRSAVTQAARAAAQAQALVDALDASGTPPPPGGSKGAASDAGEPGNALRPMRDRAALLSDLLASTSTALEFTEGPTTIDGAPDGAEALPQPGDIAPPDNITAQIVAQIGQTARVLVQDGSPVRGAGTGWPGAARPSAMLLAGDGAVRAEGNGASMAGQASAPDRLFQFARTDDQKTVLPGLGIPGAKADAASLSDRLKPDQRQPQDMIQRVAPDISIVESRKFLGVAAGQTATAAVIASVTENGEWNAMLRETAATSATILNAAKNGSNTLKIQLHPLELGIVTASFRLTGEHLTIDLKVETIEAFRQLSNDNNSIVRALKGHGYDVEQITIQHVGQDRSSGASQDSGSTSQQGGAADGRQSGARAQADGGSGQRQAPQREPDGAGDRASGVDHAGSGRLAGDVYL